MPKLWKLKPQIPSEIVAKLADLPKISAQLLYNRGLTDQDRIQDFLFPEYEKLNSPFLFKDMQKAVDRIWAAIGQNENICIYGDYDADAVTANAVLQQTFRYLGSQISSYIPDRFSEGYGINLEALEKIKLQGARIIITVDCGTNSHDAAEFCKNNNIDLIITDHHEIIGDLPNAYALINPKNRTDSYPYEEITGVGVAFKLACGILADYEKVTARLSFRKFSAYNSHQLKIMRDPEQIHEIDSGHSANQSLEQNSGMTYKGGWEKWLLDLVAIGTVADCHSLIGENRILVKYGLKVLAKTKWIGLKALMQSAGLLQEGHPLSRVTLLKEPDTYTLGFVIAPRLNAAGRLEHANVALNLLLEKDDLAAERKAAELESINQRRQQLTQTVLSEAKEKVLVISDRKVLALVGEGWPKGVMGLVAGRLAEEYYKPVIVLEQTAELCTGSARTAGEFNLIEALKFSSDHLVKYGGHKQAAGLTLQRSRFDFFYEKVLEYAEKEIVQEQSPVLELEAELTEGDLSLVTCDLLQQFEPFGVHNPKPKFLITNANVLSQRQVGSQGQHLQLQVRVGNSNFAAIAFNFKLFENTKVNIACELLQDVWNGSRHLKLRIVDIKSL